MFKKLFRKNYSSFSSEDLLENASRCSHDIQIAGKVLCNEARELLIGKRVKIGRNVTLNAYGGLIIGDDVEIDEGAVLGGDQSSIRNYVESAGIQNTTIIPPGSRVTKEGRLVALNNRREFPERKGSRLFFVLSTGRSGSNAFSEYFSGQEKVVCRHESLFLLNRISTLFEHKQINTIQVREILKAIFIDNGFFDSGIITGESDQKLVALGDVLRDLLPEAKFIWLIRNGVDFIALSYGRGWFDDWEYSPEMSAAHSKDCVAPGEIFDYYRKEYAIFRLNGSKTGSFSGHDWTQLSSFERNCWYWKYWNEKIENILSSHTKENTLFLPLEKLTESFPEICRFIGTDISSGDKGKFNQATCRKIDYSLWSEEQKRAFMRYCKEGMSKWYPDQNIS